MDTFDWTEYLEKNKSIAVPEELFYHVEASLSNGIKQGMLLEVCHKTNPDIYWIAEITMVCGHLLRIKFLGAEKDFWCDISVTKVHPLGWCGKYDEQVEPPDEINETYGDRIIDIMKSALLNGVSVAIEALKNKGQSPIDRIKVGMKVEVQNLTDPYKYWIATVQENVGGRLRLRYDGSEPDERAPWIFFSSPRLSGFGFVTSKGSPWQLRWPGSVNRFSCKNRLSAQLRQCAEEAITEPTPHDLFVPNQSNLEIHSFVVGMKLEALDPSTMRSVRPATVAKVFSNLQFLVVIDDFAEDFEDSRMAWLCDGQHPYIYPAGWAKKNKVPFTQPKTWKEETFDWDEYLTQTSSVAAPDHCFIKKEPVDGIEVDMKLEAVNPQNDEEIHVASVSRIVEHMVCVELLPLNEKVWYWQRSDCLFPVIWCDSNDYDLHIPDLSPKVEEVEEVKEAAREKKIPQLKEEWCDRIYFNYKCYAGPSLSRNKLAQLPQAVGPGPLRLVLREVLNKVISASYKPARLLRGWEAAGAAPGMRLDLLKAKLKSSTYHAYVEVATRSDQVEEFCRSVCRRLQACPALLAPRRHPACACAGQDKARFHNVTVERRGRPKGSFKKKKKPPVPDKPAPASPPSPAPAESSDSSPPRSPRRAPRPTALPRLQPARRDSDSDSRSSDSRDKNISDVSDGEEPELKKLKFSCEGPQPTDNLGFERRTSLAVLRARLRLAANPARWSVEDVHAYLSASECARAAARLRHEQVDGLALVLLDAAALRLLHMRPEYAARLGRHVALLRWYYSVNYETGEE